MITVRVWPQIFCSEQFGAPCESTHEREADLRALQSCQAQRRDSHHLQAQPQA